jgi:hypothetical protein
MMSLFGSDATDVPNLVGQSSHSGSPQPGSHLFNRDAIRLRAEVGAFGNSSRQFFHGPGINNFDIGLMKRTVITESTAFEMRIDSLTSSITTQFNNPDGNFSVFGDSMGVVTSAKDPRIGRLQRQVLLLVLGGVKRDKE